MNAYKGEWIHDYTQLLYQVREKMKDEAYNHLCDGEINFEDKVAYAKQIIKSHYMRSVEEFMNNYGKRRTHPSFREYAAMMLNQDKYLDNLQEDIRDELVYEFGKSKGIEEGSYYIPKLKE